MYHHCVLCVGSNNTVAGIAPKPVYGLLEEDDEDNTHGEIVPRRRPVVEYAKSYVMTTRFSTETWKQHREFMDMGLAGRGVHACYCSPMGISTQIVDVCVASSASESVSVSAVATVDSSVNASSNINSIKLLVLEMHNDLNRIMGIGAVFARSHYHRYAMYSDNKYNVCAFMGPYRIDRTEMTPEEEAVLVMLDALCFRGKRHMKRLRGLTLFPEELCGHVRESHGVDLRAEIQSMFRRRFAVSKSHNDNK
jgi:hypothetical protein